MGEGNFTVFLIDDDPGILTAIARLLRASGYDTKPFRSAHEFLATHDPSTPGCAVIDLVMPDIDGLQLQELLHAKNIDRPIIFLTGKGDIAASVRAIRAGALDFLTKPVAQTELLAALTRAAEVDAKIRRERVSLQFVNDRLALLTRREHEVLRHVIGGRLNKQIAGALGTVEKTIKTHRGRVMAKLGVRCVADLVRLTEQAGITPEV